VSGESRIAVAEDGLGDTVVTNHFTNEEPSKFGSRNRGGGGDVVNHLGEFIDEHHDGVVTATRTRKLSDEVHRDLLPWAVGNREWLSETHRGLVTRLVALTRVTADNIP
jgi:hypothetical protein